MRKVLMFIATVAVAFMAGHAAAADQPEFTVTSFNAPQGDFQAASISAQALTTDRLVATASPFVASNGDLWVSVTYQFSSMDIQNQWRAAGWPGFVDGVEVFFLGLWVESPSQSFVFNAVPDSSGAPVWTVPPTWTYVQPWAGGWSSTPGVYMPYLTVMNPNIAGVSGTVAVPLASKQLIDALPASPSDSTGSVNYNYSVWIMFDPIDLQMGFPADGALTMASDGYQKWQAVQFFFRILNGNIQFYTGF